MTWNLGASGGTRHNKRVRGGGTWGSEGRRLNQHQQRRFRRQLGFGSWGAQQRRLVHRRHQRERRAWGAKLRSSFTTVIVGALILSALLLFAPATRATGMMILFITGVLYVITRRKKA
jgi:hypothetical protein